MLRLAIIVGALTLPTAPHAQMANDGVIDGRGDIAARKYAVAAKWQGNADDQYVINYEDILFRLRVTPHLKAAEDGDAASQIKLGDAYYSAEKYSEAENWYRKAAAQGHAAAQFNLGFIYVNGRGVPQDDAEAVRWFRRAALQGHAEAQFNLAFMYDEGQGVPQEDDTALKWYRAAADNGNVKAQFNLGAIYDEGRGVPEDDAAAVKWYRQAAAQGYAKAQNTLGIMYENGRGVPQDAVRAHMWYSLAASRLPAGEARESALRNRDSLAERMTPGQIGEAQLLARDWEPEED